MVVVVGGISSGGRGAGKHNIASHSQHSYMGDADSDGSDSHSEEEEEEEELFENEDDMDLGGDALDSDDDDSDEQENDDDDGIFNLVLPDALDLSEMTQEEFASSGLSRVTRQAYRSTVGLIRKLSDKGQSDSAAIDRLHDFAQNIPQVSVDVGSHSRCDDYGAWERIHSATARVIHNASQLASAESRAVVSLVAEGNSDTSTTNSSDDSSQSETEVMVRQQLLQCYGDEIASLRQHPSFRDSSIPLLIKCLGMSAHILDSPSTADIQG